MDNIKGGGGGERLNYLLYPTPRIRNVLIDLFRVAPVRGALSKCNGDHGNRAY